MERSFKGGLRFVAIQLTVWAGLYGLYLFVRGLAVERADAAFTHASQLIRLERAGGLFHEASVQDAVTSVKGLSKFFDLYYMLGFGPLLLLALIWLAWRHRTAYRELRSAMLISLALASIPFVLYPTAPPRLISGLGIADTVGLAGHDAGSFAGIRFDPYAAMPSMHVGWTLLLSLVGYRLTRNRLIKILLVAHAVLMTLAVTATGNHFFVDAAAGSAIALLGYALISCRALRLFRGSHPARARLLGAGRCVAPEAA